MKKNITKSKPAMVMSLLIVGLFLLVSCKKDATQPNTKELLVYTNTNNGTYNELNMGFILVGTNVFGETKLKITASSTRPVPVDVQAKFELDTMQVKTYNAQNGTAYKTIPDGAFSLSNGGQFTIRNGAQVSDSVTLTMTNPLLLTGGGGYLIPLIIRSANGQDKLISSNRGTYFIRVATITSTFQLQSTGGLAGSINLNVTPTGVSFTNKSATFTVNSNIAVPADVSFTIEARDALIAAYNTANKTAFVSMPAGSYSILNNGVATIAKGNKSSGNFQVDFDITKFPNDAIRAYLLPVGIKGADNSAGNIIYIQVNPLVLNINPANIIPSGTAINRTATGAEWTATVTSTFSDPASSTLDGDYTSYWYSDLNGSLPQSITIDMAKSNSLKGITYATGTYSGVYDVAPKQITVYTSTDGTTWKNHGNYSGANSAEGVVNGISFYTPVTARYFRLTCIASYSDFSWVGFSEVNAFQ
jgi:hypothetical protein